MGSLFLALVIVAGWGGVPLRAGEERGSAPAPARVQPSVPLDLSGLWQVRLDALDRGIEEAWFARILEGRPIALPGTTDQAGYGVRLDRSTMTYPGIDPRMLVAGFGQRPDQKLDEMGRLVRKVYYVGPAWYERIVEIPDSWKDRQVTLRLERVLWESRLWVDGSAKGRRDSLVADHIYGLGALEPGRHRLTLCIDNRPILPTGMIQHGYGEETQIRWNGVLGRIELDAADPVHIGAVRVFPAEDRGQVRVEVRLDNALGRPARGRLQGSIEEERTGRVIGRVVQPVEVSEDDESTHEISIRTTERPRGWDEFHPNLYRARVTLEAWAEPDAREDQAAAPPADPPWSHAVEQTFGFRAIRRDGADIRLDGRRLFLRGVLDCAVYPREGHPPMDLRRWMEVMRTIKSYGFNHVRFHTWCPPEAAFEAADRLGLYLAPEAAFWPPGGPIRAPQLGENDQVTEWLRREIRWISERYGNHPSFCFFCIGNEFAPGTHWDVVDRLVREAKADDPRRLYTGSTARTCVAADDYRVTHATTNGATRGIGPPHTDWDFRKAAVDLPVISHETGQRPSFPDYDRLLGRFTGVLAPCDLELYRRRAEKSGLEALSRQFARASALFALDQYKSEHEGLLRTPGWDGYHLLQLNDFTGQGEALVGLLDPFWVPKPGITPEAVRAWNGSVVPLARFEKYVYTVGETFHAMLEVANYGERDLIASPAEWRIDLDEVGTIAAGTVSLVAAPTGAVTQIGPIDVSLADHQQAAGATLTLGIGDARNSWRLWVYPPAARARVAPPAGVLVTERFDAHASEALAAGGRVFFLAHGLVNEITEATGYSSVYWSAKMFAWAGNNNLGVYPTPGHPALERFPHDGHSDWHWWELTHDATAFRFDALLAGMRPIIQAIPDFHDPRPLLHLFDVRVGPGRLLVCGYDLTSNLEKRPVARQLRSCLMDYISSDAFEPAAHIPAGEARRLFSGWERDPRQADWRILSCDSEETKGDDGRAQNVLDGDPRTIWHTEWLDRAPPHPHQITFDLGRAETMTGLRYLPRQDGSNGRIARYEVTVSTDGKSWKSAAKGTWPNDRRPVRVFFDQPRPARYVRLTALSEVNGNPWSSAAELAPIIGE